MSEGDGRGMPQRPSVPLALVALPVVIVAERTVLAGYAALPLVLGGTLGGLLLALARRLASCKTSSRVFSVLLAMCLATALAALSAAARAHSVAAFAESLGTSPVSSWTFRLTGDLVPVATGWRGRAHAVREGSRSGDVWLILSEEVFSGDCVTCVGRFSPNADDEWGRSSAMQGVAGTVKVAHLVSRRPPDGLGAALQLARRAVIGAMDPASSDVRAVLAACVCGYVAALRASGLSDELSCAGISHMVAVSGAHLSLVGAFVSRLLEATRLKRGMRCAAVLGMTGLFVVFCGSPVSALRAWLMCATGEVSSLAGRRGDQLSAVSIVCLGMTLADPALSGQLGFLLSALSVSGIGLFGAYGRATLDALLPGVGLLTGTPSGLRRRVVGFRGDVRDLTAISLVCQAFTLPLTASSFGSVSTLALPANLVATPFFSVLVPLGLLVALCSWCGPVCQVLLAVADVVGEPLVAFVGLVSGVPMARAPVEVDAGLALSLLAVGSTLLLVTWPRPSRKALLGACGVLAMAGLCLFVRWRWLSPARVCVLDVGQGDAVLVQDGGSALLVDTGPDDSVARALAEEHVLHLDAVLVTHLHDDHYGGLAALRGTVGVDEVLVGAGVLAGLPDEVEADVAGLCGSRRAELSYGDTLRVGRFSLRVVSPPHDTDGSGNEDSVVLLLEYDDGTRVLTGLLTGDAEKDVTSEAVARGDVGDVDFLKVGHHGSAVSVDEPLARVLLPEVSVASAGEGNSYGHPREECVETLEQAGSRFLCTKDAGTVTIEPGAAGPVVSCLEVV